jgi:acid stress-induced BolA-like protein IbaG/YrbA
MALQACLNTLEDQLTFAKQLIQEYDLAYQQHFAAGRLDEMMAAKRQLAKQRNIFAKLLKEKMGR